MRTRRSGSGLAPLTPRPAPHATPASAAAWDHRGWTVGRDACGPAPLSKHAGAQELRPAQARVRGCSTNAARRHHGVQTGGGAGEAAFAASH
eukprot:scaffold52841_cov57-Phaeocystis_antarctica.AAC.1